ncbi:MAG: sulfatase-like hydrolase/transferase, partial [Planctomycetes bacterium]|nr:sulfatase-like hydrolase/transferase [Planctomycetota bacterium]
MTAKNKTKLMLLILASLSLRAMAAQQPNFLIIIADDCTYNELPLYGGQNVRTPAIDRLASEGMTFDNAY